MSHDQRDQAQGHIPQKVEEIFVRFTKIKNIIFNTG
jgi:hypothetical protein